MAQKLRNVLPNTYVPALSKKTLATVLNRLPKSSIIALIQLWPQLKNTQPNLDKENSHTSQVEYNRLVRDDAKEMRANPSKWKKARVIDKILFEYWSSGLNLLQLAQIDCQLIVDNPNSYFWILSCVKDGWDNEVPLSLNPSAFLHRLAQELTKFFMSYIYVCTHPTFPLIIIRIQVFDLLPGGQKRTKLDRPHITSHKPYFLAIPMNSPHIIHSPGNDLVSEVVLQVVEASLAQSPRNLLHLEKPKTQKAVRSLPSMHILKGSSRFGNSMGAWAPYADGTADISPLAGSGSHSTLQEILKGSESADSPEEKLRKLANIRFKGTSSGQLTSVRLYDDIKPMKRNTKKRTFNEDEDNERDMKNEFSSIAPIRYAQFEIQEPITPESEHTSRIVIKLVGTDVFAGLHELAVKTTAAEKAVVSPEIPGWLTGEEGMSCGVVKNGIFLGE